MADVHDGRLVIGTRRYSSWSLRGWLAVRLAGLNVVDQVLPLRGGGQTFELREISPNGLVPYLEHKEARIWESLAICEYCAEISPALWPENRLARAWARSISAQMHGGFPALRQALPMNLGRRMRPRADGLSEDVQADIAALLDVWERTLDAFSGQGPYLFGPEMGIADAMFAPIATRFYSYGVELTDATQAYSNAVRAHPLMKEWARLAEAEPQAWQLERYESLS